MFRSAVLAIALAFAGGAATAATVSYGGDQYTPGNGDAIIVGAPGQSMTITFDRTTSSATSMRGRFTVTHDFSLFYESSTPGTVAGSQPGGNVYAYGFARNTGSGLDFLTDQVSLDAGTTGDIAIDYNRLVEDDYTGSFAGVIQPDAGTPVTLGGQSVFAAGTYDLAFFDSSDAVPGETTFRIDVAAVPLPATALMLLAGVGGLAAMRRRASA